VGYQRISAGTRVTKKKKERKGYSNTWRYKRKKKEPPPPVTVKGVREEALKTMFELIKDGYPGDPPHTVMMRLDAHHGEERRKLIEHMELELWRARRQLPLYKRLPWESLTGKRETRLRQKIDWINCERKVLLIRGENERTEEAQST